MVCVMQHMGYLDVTDTPPSNFEAYGCVIKILRGRQSYVTKFQNGIKPRKPNSLYEGHAIKLEQVVKLKSIGNEHELLQMASEMPTEFERVPSRRQRKQQLKAQLQLQKLADPVYLAVTDSTVFNLTCDPVTKYSLYSFVDKGYSSIDSSQ